MTLDVSNVCRDMNFRTVPHLKIATYILDARIHGSLVMTVPSPEEKIPQQISASLDGLANIAQFWPVLAAIQIFHTLNCIALRALAFPAGGESGVRLAILSLLMI